MGVNFAFQVSTRTPRISSQDRNNEWFVDFDAFGTKIKDDAGIDDDQPDDDQDQDQAAAVWLTMPRIRGCAIACVAGDARAQFSERFVMR